MSEPQKPRIQYVRSRDGTNVGAWKAGSGPPLVVAASYASDIQSDWDMPQLRWYRRLAENLTLVSYDRRGGGASDSDVSDRSLDALVSDLEAVVDWAKLDRFPLLGPSHASLVAIAYAARHPDRVSHLVIFQGYADAAKFQALPKIQAARALLAKDFRAYVETSVFFEQGWAGREVADTVAGYFAGKTSQEGLLKEFAELDRINLTDLLPQIQAPSLILHRRRAPYPPLEMARDLAAGIPDSELVLVEGEQALVWDTDSEEVCQLIERFIAEKPGASTTSPQIATSLSRRELDVLRLVAQGQSNKEIAGELSLSVHTIERHLANIYAKIGARGRADATAYAHKSGLV